MNILAVVLAFAVSYIAGNYKLSFIYVVAAGLLWFYSSTYKKMFLIGNLVVSLLVALTVLLPVLFELPVLIKTEYGGVLSPVQLQAARIILYTVFGYFIFAFLTTLIREIVKDMEDIKGDMSDGANTIPVILGFTNTKWLVAVLWITLIGLTGWVSYTYYQSQQMNRALYFVFAVQLPSLAGIFLLFKYDEPKQFSAISFLLKIIMLLGILSMGVFYLMS
jgi:4-hydroxybenzoate polyprenyltransferase